MSSISVPPLLESILQPSWPVFLGVLLRSEAICLSFRLSGYFVWSVIFLCLLRLGQFLLSHALFFPDLTFSSSNLVFSLRVANGGGSYLFQSADSCKYAPRSLNRVGYIPIEHRGMLQGTACTCACLFDPYTDLTSLFLHLACLVDILAEEALPHEDCLRSDFHVFLFGLQLVWCLFGTQIHEGAASFSCLLLRSLPDRDSSFVVGGAVVEVGLGSSVCCYAIVSLGLPGLSPFVSVLLWSWPSVLGLLTIVLLLYFSLLV